MQAQVHPKLRIFLADDHPVVLAGIRAIVATDPRLEVVGEAADGPAALQRAIDLKPDVAVLDLSMPGMNGVEVARQFLSACAASQVLVLTVHEDGGYLRQLLDIGVAGFVLKRSATEDLNRAILIVASGGVYLDPAIAGRAVGRSLRPAQASAETQPQLVLSARESDVLRLIAMGHSQKTIALRLEIGVRSVDTYKSRAMTKLGLRNRGEVIRYAFSVGWLTGL
jgi:DNA-binding NarL/FixJ family response regulator